MTKEEIIERGLLEQYVLGLTEEEENKIVLDALEKHPELKEYLDRIERTMESIAQQNAIVPPKDLRDKTFKRIAGSEKLPISSGNSRIVRDILGGILGLVLLGSLYYFYQAFEKSNNELNAKIVALDKLIQDCNQKDENLTFSTRLLSLYESENYQTYTLKPTSQPDNGGITVFWDDNQNNAYLYNQSLPKAPKGKTYQIWADVDQVMIPLGIFGDNPISEIKCLKRATSLNVTIEPAGGSEHPTVENLIMSIQV
jgi:anti-sigma-K factor RskA